MKLEHSFNSTLWRGGVAYLFHISSDILLDVVLLHRLHGTVHCILLHLIRHVCILDDGLLVRHGGFLAVGAAKKIIMRDSC
uniref:Uncharacterized protein n=1 Tax=Salarias fasciatus TaxID=181472 RepID=A0A672HMT9_SALFA